ncbi:hypothetical protein RhiirA4_456580 [Rhizophagus irregularis]|uniref:Uncharacterized protein n=1 Tax=Rhizophagus irregularis TaxID=588596 RepID=A0A2I1G7W9_9GLOM|nr:hypothetical protein RhiirA4_456580 [Rhizophagus irregularis]
MKKEIFRLKETIDKSIVIFLEKDGNVCWENYIGRETKKTEKSSYETLKKNEYLDMVKMFKENQDVYKDTKRYSRIRIKNDENRGYYYNWFLAHLIKVDEIVKKTIKEGKNETIIYLRILEESLAVVEMHIIIRSKEKKIKLIMQERNDIMIEERPIEEGLGWIRSKLILGNEIYIRRKNGG